jgi:hypothetical protein
VIITCRGISPANELHVAREVSSILDRRAALARPPRSLTVSGAVALGIADIFRGPTPSGQVMDGFVRRGAADSDELIAAARFEQDYSSPEGHAALYCLIGWVNNRVTVRAGAPGPG